MSNHMTTLCSISNPGHPSCCCHPSTIWVIVQEEVEVRRKEHGRLDMLWAGASEHGMLARPWDDQKMPWVSAAGIWADQWGTGGCYRWTYCGMNGGRCYGVWDLWDLVLHNGIPGRKTLGVTYWSNLRLSVPASPKTLLVKSWQEWLQLVIMRTWIATLL